MDQSYGLGGGMLAPALRFEISPTADDSVVVRFLNGRGQPLRIEGGGRLPFQNGSGDAFHNHR
jgi:hypothetical protein